jgi:hypothetical protein
MAPLTHEQFIQAVRDTAVKRLEEQERLAALDAKLVYGAGSRRTRGVTYFGAWKNGHEHALAEICAFGEDSPVQVAGTTLHELGHVLAGPGKGHGKGWAQCCERLGLRFVRAAGTKYSLACFSPDIRMAIAELMPRVTDGKPQRRDAGIPLQFKIRPCSAGLGARGGKGRDRKQMRKFVCSCGVIARVCRDEFPATCNLCGSGFTLEEKVTMH